MSLEVTAQHLIAELLRSGYAEIDMPLRRQNGSIITVRTRLTLFEAADKSQQVLSISYDRSLELQIIAEQQARAEAEAAIRLRDEFLAIAAHELKTPMTSLQGYVQLLELNVQRDALDHQRVLRSVEHIKTAGQRLTRLINQLLDVSRIGAGKAVLHTQIIDLCHLVSETAMRAHHHSPQRHIQVTQPFGGISVRLDVVRMQQVIDNVLDNALKFSDQDIAIDVHLTEPDWVELSISDHGPGIAAELRDRIFERAFQADPAAAEAGLGLGLYISYQLVNMHGGRIWVEPGEENGARFVIRLPTGVSHAA